MSSLNRRGIIGFVLTMALGAALGAAALVVGNEVKKENSNKQSKQPLTSSIGNQLKVKHAFASYELAYKNYKQAIAQNRPDVSVYAKKLQLAKNNLENKMKGKSVDTDSVVQSDNQYADPIAENMKNPFTNHNVVVRSISSADSGVNTSNSMNSPSLSSVDTTSAQQNEPEKYQVSENKNANNIEANTNNLANKSRSIDYYKVKKGDSLSEICKKYYGDSGMWTHILKYQIPSIAATPNLIFPGQLIALPRQSGFKGWVANSRQKARHLKNKIRDRFSPNDTSVAPAGDESWQNGFNPTYVVSDHTLTDSNSLSVSQIQRFLEHKGSVLAKPYRGSSPARMIYNAAKKYGISPKVLLTRLQCEQGLITAKSASRRRLDWALGVGCYDSGNWNQRYKGFDKQIEYAAATYKRHYDAAKRELASGRSLNMIIDHKHIHVRNAATYAFYKYCPHFAGNKLFINVWNGYKKEW